MPPHHETFSIRPPLDADWRPLRMLLPDIVHFNCPCELAVAHADSLVIGAAALDRIIRPTPISGQRFALHVIPPWRNHGVGKALLAWAEQAAQRRGSAALFSWSSVVPQTPHALVWQRLGFNYSQSHPHTQLDVDATVAYLQAAESRLNSRCPPPANARILPLREATAAQRAGAVRLQMAHLGGDADAVAARLDPDYPDAADQDFSHILLLHDRVIGLALVRRMSVDSAYIQADVVDPQFRHGWANFLLKLTPALACQRAAMRTFVFETFDEHGDSRRFAQKVGGQTIQRVDLYRLINPAAK